MLVLTRRTDEQIVIQMGDTNVIVRVVAVDRDRVRLGIAAPHEVLIHREEVLRRIEAGADHSTLSLATRDQVPA